VSVLRFDPFGDPFRQMDRLTNQLLSGTRTPMGMPMDVFQTDDGFHVCLDLPGVDPDSVDITTERNTLTIKAERRAEYEDGQNVLIAERPQGTSLDSCNWVTRSIPRTSRRLTPRECCI
jgi:HSP20 family protein